MPWKGLFASEKGCECTIQNIWGQPVVKRENHLLSLICLVNQLYYDKATHRMLRGSRRRVPSGIWGSGRHHGGASAQLQEGPGIFDWMVSQSPSSFSIPSILGALNMRAAPLILCMYLYYPWWTGRRLLTQPYYSLLLHRKHSANSIIFFLEFFLLAPCHVLETRVIKAS